jgi:hypothetical protein
MIGKYFIGIVNEDGYENHEHFGECLLETATTLTFEDNREYNKRNLTRVQESMMTSLRHKSRHFDCNYDDDGDVILTNRGTSYKARMDDATVMQVDWSDDAYINVMLCVRLCEFLGKDNVDIMFTDTSAKVPYFIEKNTNMDCGELTYENCLAFNTLVFGDTSFKNNEGLLYKFTFPNGQQCLGFLAEALLYTKVTIIGFYEPNGAITGHYRLHEYAAFVDASEFPIFETVFHFSNPPPLKDVEPIKYMNIIPPGSFVSFTKDGKPWKAHLAYIDPKAVCHFMYVFHRNEDYQPFVNYETISIPLMQLVDFEEVALSRNLAFNIFSIMLHQIMQSTINDNTKKVHDISEPIYDIMVLITAHGGLNHKHIPIEEDDTVSIIRFSEHGYSCSMMNDDRLINSVKGTLRQTNNQLIHTFNALQAAKVGTTSTYAIYNVEDFTLHAQFAPKAKYLYDVKYGDDHGTLQSDDSVKSHGLQSHYGVYVMHSSRDEHPIGYRFEQIGKNNSNFTLSMVYSTLRELGYKTIGIIEYACNYDEKHPRKPSNHFGGSRTRKKTCLTTRIV